MSCRWCHDVRAQHRLVRPLLPGPDPVRGPCQSAACRNFLTAGIVMTTLLAASSAQDQMKVGAMVRVMSRWSLSLASVGARTEATPMTLVTGGLWLAPVVLLGEQEAGKGG